MIKSCNWLLERRLNLKSDLEWNEKDELKKSYKQQKKVLYLLLGNTYIFFMGLVLGEVQAISDFNYSLHEVISATANLMFLSPVLLLVYVYFGIKYLSKRGLDLPDLKSGLKVLFVVGSIIGIFSFTFIKMNEFTSHGVLEVQEKIKEENQYYLMLNGKKVKVTENEYYLINQNEVYLGSYKWNKLSPTNGELLTIKPD